MKKGSPVFVGLGTNVHGWSLLIPGRSRVSYGVVVSLKRSVSGDVYMFMLENIPHGHK